MMLLVKFAALSLVCHGIEASRSLVQVSAVANAILGNLQAEKCALDTSIGLENENCSPPGELTPVPPQPNVAAPPVSGQVPPLAQPVLPPQIAVPPNLGTAPPISPSVSPSSPGMPPSPSTVPIPAPATSEGPVPTQSPIISPGPAPIPNLLPSPSSGPIAPSPVPSSPASPSQQPPLSPAASVPAPAPLLSAPQPAPAPAPAPVPPSFVCTSGLTGQTATIGSPTQGTAFTAGPCPTGRFVTQIFLLGNAMNGVEQLSEIVMYCQGGGTIEEQAATDYNTYDNTADGTGFNTATGYLYSGTGTSSVAGLKIVGKGGNAVVVGATTGAAQSFALPSGALITGFFGSTGNSVFYSLGFYYLCP